MRSAAVRQCVVLVGGLGTRLGELTAAVPKPLLTCGDRPFLAWLLREYVRYGFDDFLLLAGHLSGVVEAALPAIAAGLPKPVRIRCSVEPLRAGTGGALYHARELLAERFVLCNGDSLLDFNIAGLLADAEADGAAVAGRMTLRAVPDTSRYGVVALSGDHVTAFRERPEAGRPGIINAGVYVLDRCIADSIGSVSSLERDVLPALAARGALRGSVAGGYFIDIGVVADLERAQTELPDRLRRRALFVGRDGVGAGDRQCAGSPEWLAETVAVIRDAVDAGSHVFAVIDRFRDETGLNDRMADQLRAARATLDDLRFWPSPGDRSAGMLLDLMAKWEVGPSACRFVGCHPDDIAAASAVGIELFRDRREFEGASNGGVTVHRRDEDRPAR